LYSDIFRMPWDGKVYEIKPPDYCKRVYARGFLRVTDLGGYVGVPASINADVAIGNVGRRKIAFIAVVRILKDGSKSRRLLVYMEHIPKDAETVLASQLLSIDEADAFAFRLSDMLRVGKEWRAEGTFKDTKIVRFSPVGEVSFRMVKLRGLKSPTSHICVDSKGYDLALLYLDSVSLLADDARTCADWLSEQ
jgi:hypothetical protein